MLVWFDLIDWFESQFSFVVINAVMVLFYTDAYLYLIRKVDKENLKTLYDTRELAA